MKCYAIGLEQTRILVIKVPKRWVKKKHTKNMVKNNQNKVNVFVIMILIFTWTCLSFESFSACRLNLISKNELS